MQFANQRNKLSCRSNQLLDTTIYIDPVVLGMGGLGNDVMSEVGAQSNTCDTRCEISES